MRNRDPNLNKKLTGWARQNAVSQKCDRTPSEVAFSTVVGSNFRLEVASEVISVRAKD